MSKLSKAIAVVGVFGVMVALAGAPMSAKGGPTVNDPYGAVQIWVKRGSGVSPTGDYGAWAQYSTALESPFGNDTGGTFRFTCKTAWAPCEVSWQAAVVSKKGGEEWLVWPRILIHRQDYVNAGSGTDNFGYQHYCEYGDHIDNDDHDALVTATKLADLLFAPFNLGIGGSADCGGPNPAAGSVPVITVPDGYYDVSSSFKFYQLP